MGVLSVGELVDRIQDFERRLEAYYADVRDHATQDGARLLAYYLSRHRRHLPGVLSAFSAAELAEIRLEWVRYDDTEFDPKRLFVGSKAPADISGRELLQTGIAFIEELLVFYRWLDQQSLGEHAKRLVQGLLHTEETHIVELKKTLATDYF